jgi:NADPH:quinone reductase-like Zn-dependent oxidoreductase
MRKVIYNKFGDETVLDVTEQPIPTFKDDHLLIRVKAVSINPLDWKVYGGEMKLMSGSKFPKAVGIDFSGIVENTGNLVSHYKAGDQAIGMMDVFKGGALADYVVVKETDLSPKAANISFEQAAALPVAGLSAIQIIDELAAVSRNQEVLIIGATGGIGIFAMQIAKQRGAKVTAVVGPNGVDEAKKRGADTIIDRSKQNVLSMAQRFDAVIDLSTTLTFKSAKKLLKSKAVFITTLPAPVTLVYSFLNNLLSSKKLKVLILKPSAKKFSALTTLAEKDLQIVLYKTYSINQIRKAYREARQGKIIGKSVIVLD